MSGNTISALLLIGTIAVVSLFLAVVIKEMFWRAIFTCFGAIFLFVAAVVIGQEALGQGKPKTTLQIGRYYVFRCNRTRIAENKAVHDCWLAKPEDQYAWGQFTWYRFSVSLDLNKPATGFVTYHPGTILEVYKDKGRTYMRKAD